MNKGQTDSKERYDMADTVGYSPESGTSREKPTQQIQTRSGVIKSSPIDNVEFYASEYKVCPKIGKAVIVSNFMDGYVRRPDFKSEDPECREYASDDCKKLKAVLERLGFERLNGDDDMVHKNLTRSQFEELYQKAAQQENYRPESVDSKPQGYTCVLFIVMSYGRSGLIKCHAEKHDATHEYAKQTDLQEAFQPQNNHSLALKPKIFIVQTIPEPTDLTDDHTGGGEERTTIKRIPREADFLIYSSDSCCLDFHAEDNGSGDTNKFVQAIVEGLDELAKYKEENKPALEIQRLLIKMNNIFKKSRKKGSEWKIPCVTSSLTKQLKLF